MRFNDFYFNERSIRPPVYKDVLFVYDYPGRGKLTDEDRRIKEISIAIKDSVNVEEIKEAAKEMAVLAKRENILVPVPNSKGNTSANLKLAEEIAKISGSEVRDIIGIERERERESNRLRSKAGLRRLEPQKLGYKLVGDVGDARKVLFIDNVAGSGSTIRALVNLINGGRGLVFSRTKRAKRKIY